MIKLININKTYGVGENAVQAARNINLEVAKGEFIAIIGESGSGKTTLMNLIGAVDTATSGEIYYENVKVSDYNLSQRAKFRLKNTGFIFQQYFLEESFDVALNVELPLIIAGEHEASRREKVLAILKQVGLEKKARSAVKNLSGGEMQRVAIARALVGNPSVIFADEPTGNLDTKNGKNIIDILVSIAEQGCTVIMVTHNMKDAERANRILRMHDGELYEN